MLTHKILKNIANYYKWHTETLERSQEQGLEFAQFLNEYAGLNKGITPDDIEELRRQFVPKIEAVNVTPKPELKFTKDDSAKHCHF